jgi:hypothetical protein
VTSAPPLEVQTWHIDRLVLYARNPRKNDAVVDRMCSSIREFGFKIPVLARSDGEVVDGHLRIKAARELGINQIPVILCDEWTPAQVKAFRLLVNRSVTWASWDEELLALELQELSDADFDLDLTGLWRDRAGLNGGDFGSKRTVASKARAAVDPQYHAEPSYLKRRTEGHTETSISGDTKADWSDAFELVPSLQIAYVWHASRFTREVLDGLLRIGFVHHQQIIWDKQRTVLTRTLYWFQHEPCWFVRKKNAPWYGKAGENSTIWASPSPKFVMGGSDETKFDHPTQKPVDLMRRPILNHTKRGELVYDPFLGSGTTLAAAELTERVCCGLELDPKYIDVVVKRWQTLSGKQARLEGDWCTFDQIAQERRDLNEARA